MNKKIVLDASALLALLQNEKGAEIVKPLLTLSSMSSVNIAETLTKLTNATIPPAEAMPLISSIIPDIIPFDIIQAQLAAELNNLSKDFGLSLGDRACIALGITLNATIYTADKIWLKLKLKNLNIKAIR